MHPSLPLSLRLVVAKRPVTLAADMASRGMLPLQGCGVIDHVTLKRLAESA